MYSGPFVHSELTRKKQKRKSFREWQTRIFLNKCTQSDQLQKINLRQVILDDLNVVAEVIVVIVVVVEVVAKTDRRRRTILLLHADQSRTETDN